LSELTRAKGNIKRKYSFSVYLICFIFLYALFALDRIKKLLSFVVAGSTTTNEIWIIPLVCILLYTYKTVKTYRLSFNKVNLIFLVYIYLYIIVIIVGGFNVVSMPQYGYAGLLFIIPMFLLFPMAKYSNEDIRFLFKVFVGTCLIYEFFTIVLIKNYAYFMLLLGNSMDNRYYDEYRASMMIGSSITVSYYFNLALPLCFYMLYCSKEKKWRIISALAIILNVIASLGLLSRTANISTVLIIILNFLLVRSTKNNSRKKIIFIVLVIAAAMYAFKNYDLTRLTNGFSGSGDSVEARLVAGNIGLYISTKFPIFGSGMGRYFERLYDFRFIDVDGIIGLIDPHNMYILIMSELGIVGLGITILLFIHLFKRFSYIKEKHLRQTAYITLFIPLFDAFGGSHILNEISYSTIFWIYMGVFNAVSIKDRRI
jgi:O-antigen ligase